MTGATPGPLDPKRDPSRKPPTLSPRPDDIPLVLVALSQWVRWRWSWDVKRQAWTKVPIRPQKPYRASTTNPASWGTFDAVVSRLDRDGVDGIGFVFSAADPFCGVDLDHCRDPETETITDEALAVIAALDGYTELSVTGTGVHVIVRASMGDLSGRKSPFIEVYDRARYFATSGHRLPSGEAPR